MPTDHRAQLRNIRTFPQLICYLRDEMGWPIEHDDFEELTFEYTPEELGIDTASAAKIQEIKRLRPFSPNQPWGIFFVKFEPKRLPVVALRRILGQVVCKKRASANSAERAAWAADDLLFVSNFGEGDERQISFAHFSQDRTKADLPILKVLGWNDRNTALHLDGVATELATKLSWPEDESNVDRWREKWRSAFTLRPDEVIKTSKALAVELAKLARAIHDRILAVLAIETANGVVTKLMKAFQEALVHDLDDSGFADMYAQTIAYGLLSARVTNPKANTADGFAAQLPVTNPFLKELMETFLQVGGRNGKARSGPGIDFDELGVSEVVELLDDANMEAVVRDFGDKNPQEDPVIHFYELFLKEYDARKRMQRGVFYTPQPVVSYIVRSVHELLQTEFGLEDGLADTTTWGEMGAKQAGLKVPAGVNPTDPFIQILDPATGTATFLVEVIDVIHRTLTAKWKQQRLTDTQQCAAWNEYVPKYLLPRLHGYELLMAPYAIGHMKIGLKLYETGYRFESDERARIYLTNALEPAGDENKQREFEEWAPALAHEAKAVNAIKSRQSFTVLLGNPPYSGQSANSGEWVAGLMQDYYFVNGVPLGERNPKWLQDDYVKFIRLAHSLLAKAPVGIVGYITNHGYLDNPTFRGMRWSLMTTFSKICVLDLHGNSKKREVRPGGGVDENVFDIQQGVAVCLFTRNASLPSRAQVSHADFWGTRHEKYDRLSGMSVNRTQFRSLTPSSPFYLFVPQDEKLRVEYQSYVSLTEAMPTSNVGFVTSRDEFVMAFEREALLERFEEFRDRRISDKVIQARYPVGKLAVSAARDAFSKRKDWLSTIVECQYRPFDQRAICYAEELLERPRMGVMRHLLHRANIALMSARSNKSAAMDHFYCSRLIAETKCAESSTQSCVFPLYVFPEARGLLGGKERIVNYSATFLQALAEHLSLRYEGRNASVEGLSPEDIFHYTYGVFHSPTYRSRYAEFLKIDFPRLPLTANLELFRALARLGGELVALHLLESPKLDQPTTEFIGGRNPEVKKVSWSKNTVWVDKAQTTGFRGVHEDVWNFHIGGYQVCEKWLKDRKGRTLSKDDIVHYQKIVVSLTETIRLMHEIDKVIDAHGGWPEAFALKVSAAPQLAAEPVVPPDKPLEEVEVTEYGTPEDRVEEAPPLAAEQPGAGISAEDDSGNAEPQNAAPTGAAHSIFDTTREESIAAIRDLFSSPAHVAGLDREMAIREVAQRLGFERTGPRIREFIEGDLLAAAHRRVISNDRGTLRLDTTSIEDYSRDELKRYLLTVLGAKWWDQEEAIRAAARHLGFRRTGVVIQEAFKSAINGLIRQGQLERDGSSIRAVK